jgi:hypothetical protein
MRLGECELERSVETRRSVQPLSSAGFAGAILLFGLGGGREERGASRATTVGRGTKSPSEV